MASVSVDDVRDVINVSSDEVSDAKVLKMVKRAEVTLELETDKEIDYNSCTDAEKEFITVLAAIYAICYLRLLSVEECPSNPPLASKISSVPTQEKTAKDGAQTLCGIAH